MMNTTGERKTAVAAKNGQAVSSIHVRRMPLPPRAPFFLEDVQREHGELFAWLTDYNHAVAQHVGRSQLLAIFDATLESVRKHFRLVEALFEQTSWPRFRQHHLIHCRITGELEAYRVRMASSDVLDTMESAHVLDDMLIQLIREEPLFNRLSARHRRLGSGSIQAPSNIEPTCLRRQ